MVIFLPISPRPPRGIIWNLPLLEPAGWRPIKSDWTSWLRVIGRLLVRVRRLLVFSLRLLSFVLRVRVLRVFSPRGARVWRVLRSWPSPCSALRRVFVRRVVLVRPRCVFSPLRVVRFWRGWRGLRSVPCCSPCSAGRWRRVFVLVCVVRRWRPSPFWLASPVWRRSPVRRPSVLRCSPTDRRVLVRRRVGFCSPWADGAVSTAVTCAVCWLSVVFTVPPKILFINLFNIYFHLSLKFDLYRGTDKRKRRYPAASFKWAQK